MGSVIERFKAAVEANIDQPLLVRDFCQMVGVPDRLLRALCQDELGISPHRFRAMRRLQLARDALLRADHRETTVTEIATEHGVWQFGRFAESYKALFGESPSTTLRRTP